MDAIGILIFSLIAAGLTLAIGSTFSGRQELPLARDAAALAVGAALLSTRSALAWTVG